MVRVLAFALSFAVALAAVPVGGAAADPLFLPASRQGPWLAADKELHFAGSLAIAASLRVEGQNEATALLGTLAIGVLKETYDATIKPKASNRGASWKDLAADIAGALAGVLLLNALDP